MGLTSNDQANKAKPGEPAKTNHVNDSEAATSNKPGPVRIASAPTGKDVNIAIKRWLSFCILMHDFIFRAVWYTDISKILVWSPV